VVVHFVDIGGIVDHHCLNFLFIMPLNYPMNINHFSLLVLRVWFPEIKWRSSKAYSYIFRKKWPSTNI